MDKVEDQEIGKTLGLSLRRILRKESENKLEREKNKGRKKMRQRRMKNDRDDRGNDRSWLRSFGFKGKSLISMP
jgi:hypothetical protein